MRIALVLSPSQLRKGPLSSVAWLVVGAFAAYEAAECVLGGDLQSLAYAGMILLGGVIVVKILNNWRTGVYLFLSWLLFEDFARKFLGNNMAIYFAKDFLLLVVLISFLSAYRRKEVAFFRPPFRLPLLLFFWFGVLQVFNPASTSVWYGIMGMKLYFYYAFLLFIGYALLNSEAEIRRFFTVNLILAFIIVTLGIAQSIVGPSFLNPTVMQEDIRELSGLYRVSPITGLVAYRPTSVFVSAGRYADFVLVAWLLVLGFTGFLLLRQRRGRFAVFIVTAVIAAGAFLTSSRGTFMWALINGTAVSVAFVWGAPWRQGEALRSFRGIQRALLGVALGITLLFFTFPDALLSRLAIYQETLTPNTKTSELGIRAWDYPVQNFLGAFDSPRWPYGYGIGTASNGVQYVARIMHAQPMGIGVESGYGTLVVELGIVGLLLWLVMSSAIVFSAWKVVKTLKGSPWFPLGFVIFWYAFVLLFPATFAGLAAYEDFILNAYLWLLLGMLFRLPTIALSAQYTTGAQAGQSQRRWMH